MLCSHGTRVESATGSPCIPFGCWVVVCCPGEPGLRRGNCCLFRGSRRVAAEAHLVALACSTPPAGRERWTLRLLANEVVRLDVVETVSYETVRRTLEQTRFSPG